jgi:hypothetical protein
MRSPRRVIPLLAAALAAVFVTAGCELGDDGPRTSQARDVAPFTAIDSDSSVDVRVHAGEPQRVRVRAGEEVIDDVGTEVRDGTLHVTFDHRGFGGDDVVVDAIVPRLRAIRTSGSGDVHADGVEADAFEVRSDGSGDVTVRGSAGRVAIELDGSGDADLGELAAKEGRVTVNGSGDADVAADTRLDVDVDGSGDLRYHGDPEVTRRVDGSGDVQRAG